MATITTAQKAPVLIAGAPDPGIAVQVSGPSLSVQVTTTAIFIVGVSPDPNASITVTKDGRSGTLAIEVTDAPLDVSLGDPEPK